MATRPSSVRVFAPAKINLFLHVTGKRADGYHDLESLVAFAGVGDTLAIEPAKGDFSLTLEGAFASALPGAGNNLVLKAAQSLSAHVGVGEGARISLRKELPVASGIGGGSADAAAAIRGLASLWGLAADNLAELSRLASEIGSDVPVCLQSRTAWMEGRGERVTPLPDFPDIPIVLVNPGMAISTADVFRRLVIGEKNRVAKPHAAFASLERLLVWLADTRNDLEQPAKSIAPVIGDVLNALNQHGAAFARMSGSGATCFGLFNSKESAMRAAHAIAEASSGWWVRATTFVSADAARPRAQ